MRTTSIDVLDYLTENLLDDIANDASQALLNTPLEHALYWTVLTRELTEEPEDQEALTQAVVSLRMLVERHAGTEFANGIQQLAHDNAKASLDDP